MSILTLIGVLSKGFLLLALGEPDSPKGPLFIKHQIPVTLELAQCGFWLLKKYINVEHETALTASHESYSQSAFMIASYNWYWPCFLFGLLIFHKGIWVLLPLSPCHQVFDYTSHV